MPLEIERKYLVKSDEWRMELTEADSSFIQQAYLSTDPDRVVRVRTRDNKAFITIKSRSIGLTRSEYEYPIPLSEGSELLKLSATSVIEKRRYIIKNGGKTWEVDEFLGKHSGLVMAEIELNSESESFSLPTWVGQEVSNDPKFSNLQLALDS